MATSQDFVNWVCLPDRIDYRFLKYVLLAEHDSLLAFASGTTHQTIYYPEVKAFHVCLPPRDVQQKIADVLTALDDLIDSNRRRIELLEQMAQAIYREWFVRFRYPGHEEVRLVDSPIGPIPEGWGVRAFSEVGVFTNGFAFKPSHWGDFGRPIIKIKELKQGVKDDTPRCNEEEIDPKFWIEAGDLLFSWSADLGAYRWPHEPGLLNQHLFKVDPVEGMSVEFLFHALQSAIPQFWDRAQGTTMRHIKRSALSEVTTTVPCQLLVDRFTQDSAPMHRTAITLRAQSYDLAAMRDLLLPRLVTGRIDVSRLDLDAVLEGAPA